MIRRDAHEHARSTVVNAHRNADQVIAEARTHADRTLSEAKNEAEQNRRAAQRQVQELIGQRDSITGHLNQLRTLLSGPAAQQPDRGMPADQVVVLPDVQPSKAPRPAR